MIKAHTSRCRGCGAPVGRRDRCFNCGSRWPQLNEKEIKAHNRLCVLIFALLVAITVTIGWISLRVTDNPNPESEVFGILMGKERPIPEGEGEWSGGRDGSTGQTTQHDPST